MRFHNSSAALIFSSLTALTLTGCQTTDAPSVEAQASPSATAQLAGPDGGKFGTAVLTAIDGGLKLEVKAENLAMGQHGIHLHMTGKCEGPKFVSAGGHWNPTAKQHGLENPQGSHSGDLPNLDVKGDGVTTFSYELRGASLSDGPMAVLDADGTAIVIHAKADDNVSDPAGNSGDRVVCGVFVKN